MKQVVKNIILPFFQNTSIYKRWREHQDKQWQITILNELKKRENEKSKISHKIEVVNLNADDVCNSRCVMCNIWKQKKQYEVSPDDLVKILSDPLYKDVKHIGVTGGEPTLREDLPLLYESLFKALPEMEGASIITNCIKSDVVIERIEEVIDMCERYNKSFSMMVSLDGYGEVHDKVRRIKGNFESAIKVLNHFRNKGIGVVTGTTISKVNVWDVDELLDYLKENNISGRFRIAEFIKRLYNDENEDIIRNFDEDEKYHLILFFYKLIMTYEKNGTYQRTYRSIINILSGGSRLIGCPYHSEGVVLNSRGEVSYCAPKSKIIGNALEDSSLKLYESNLDERSRIRRENCDDCIHDYHAPVTYKEKAAEFEEVNWRLAIQLDTKYKSSVFDKVDAAKVNISNPQFFITGWYGTETVGDKAILGQVIIDLYQQYGKDIDIVVSSIYPLITKRTMSELGFDHVKVVFVYSKDFVSYIKGSESVIIGGGPLMDLEDLAIPLYAFRIAKSHNLKTVIAGCGLGPLMFVKYQVAVKEILNLADVIQLRDWKSVELANDWTGGGKNIEMVGDPAKRYLSRYKNKAFEPKDKKVLSCFLRELTTEYAIESLEEFESVRNKFESALATYIKQKAIEIGADEIYLDHMHNFQVGNDDRDFSRRFIRTYFSDFQIPISYNKKLSTVDSIVETMKTSTVNICMRFHSVVFAHTLETNFLAIDYTRGGKIQNYLTDNSCLDRLISVDDIIKHGN